MSKLNLDEFRLIILNEKLKIINSLSLNKSISEIDSDGDPVDKIQSDLLSDLHDKLSVRNSNRLRSLNKALERIDENSFGICEDCEDDIPYKRMLFNPCTTTCICCAEAREL